MQVETQVKIVVAQPAAHGVQAALTDIGVEYTVREVRSFDGLAALAAILISGGSHAAKKLVDGLANLITTLFQTKENSASDRDSSSESVADLEIRRGGMVLSLKNAPLHEIKRIIEFADKPPVAE